MIANPKNVELFNDHVQELINDEDVDKFQISVKKVYETLEYVIVFIYHIFIRNQNFQMKIFRN